MTTTLKMAQLIEDIRTEAQGWRNEKMHEAADMMDNWANCIEALTAPRAAADTEREAFEQMLELARRTLWLAYVWNDHNFEAAHIEARKTARQNGIDNLEQANKWLADMPHRIDRAALAQPAKEQEPYSALQAIIDYPVAQENTDAAKMKLIAINAMCAAPVQQEAKPVGTIGHTRIPGMSPIGDVISQAEAQKDDSWRTLFIVVRPGMAPRIGLPIGEVAASLRQWYAHNPDAEIYVVNSWGSSAGCQTVENGREILFFADAAEQAEAQSKSDKQEDGGRDL